MKKIQEKDTDDEHVTPSKMIDEMCHACILSTNEYIAFRNHYNNGDFHHHNPSVVHEPSHYRLTTAPVWPLPVEVESWKAATA